MGVIRKRANETSKSWDTYLDYSIHFFQNTEFLDERKWIKRIPEDIRDILWPVIPWLISQESKYNKSATNKSGARWSTQVLRWNTIYKDEAFIKFMPIQIRECFRHFETIWTHLDNKVDFESFRCEYSLSGSEFNNFMVLCMINAYNTGQGRMWTLINKFQNDIPFELANKREDKTAEWLFNLMSELAYHKKWSKWYGSDSFNYTSGCLAYAKRLETWEINSGITDIPRVYLREVKGNISNTIDNNKPLIVGSSVWIWLWTTVVANNVSSLWVTETFSNIVDNITEWITSSVEDILWDSKLNRRDFLIKTWVAWIWFAWAAIAWINSEELLGMDFPSFDIDFDLFEPNEDEYINNADVVLMELDNYYSKNERFFSGDSLWNQNRRKKTIQKNKRFNRNYDKRVIPKMEEQDSDILYDVTRKDLDKGLKNLDFVKIPHENEFWRLYWIGHGSKVKENSAFLRDEWLDVLKELTQNFKEKIEESWIWKGWSIRPVVSSLTRPKEHKIWSKDTVHNNGLWIDISYTRFDLIDEENKTYIDLNNTTNKRALSIKAYAQSIMMQVLSEMDIDGKLIFTNETRSKKAPHFHVSTLS